MGRHIMDDRKETQRQRVISAFVPAASIALVFLFLAASLPIAAEQAPMVVAVAPFTDEVGFHEDLARWAPARLTVLLSRKGVRVVPFVQVQSTLLGAGGRASTLVTLAAAEDLAHLLQADIVVTGRLIRAEKEREGAIDPVDQIGPPESTVTFKLRMLVVATRQTFYDEETGYKIGGPDGLSRAADLALQQYVDRWPMTLP